MVQVGGWNQLLEAPGSTDSGRQVAKVSGSLLLPPQQCLDQVTTHLLMEISDSQARVAEEAKVERDLFSDM